MKAVGKYLVIKDLDKKQVSTKGGLLLSDKQRKDIRYREAEVLNPGTDVKSVNKTDKIYYDRHAGHQIEIDNNIYHVIKIQDVVVVL